MFLLLLFPALCQPSCLLCHLVQFNTKCWKQAPSYLKQSNHIITALNEYNMSDQLHQTYWYAGMFGFPMCPLPNSQATASRPLCRSLTIIAACLYLRCTSRGMQKNKTLNGKVGPDAKDPKVLASKPQAATSRAAASFELVIVYTGHSESRAEGVVLRRRKG